jgi:hypothetical protein
MDLNQAIRTGYFRELNNSILFQGNVVRIFDSFAIPAEVEFPYIVMANISSAQVSVKRCFVFNASTQIDIMTGSISPIGREQSEIISEQIQNILIPLDFTDINLSAYGFEVGSSELIDNTDLTSTRAPYYIFRKTLRINHLINKL